MSNKQQIQMRKLHEQKGIVLPHGRLVQKLTAQFKVDSQQEEGVVKKKEGKTPAEPVWERNRVNPMVSCQALGIKCKEFNSLDHQKWKSTQLVLTDLLYLVPVCEQCS